MFFLADQTDSGLAAFDQDLCKFSRYNMVRPLATLNYSSDTFVGSNIVSRYVQHWNLLLGQPNLVL